MRIPVYRSGAQLSDRAPGARITARMNPNTFVNAELQKGGVLTEIANQAAAYSQERYKAIVEAQRNEAVFGAKEKLLQASFALGNDDDIYNIFDGKKKYDTTVKKIFEDSLKVVGNNKYAQEDFKQAFNTFELAERFRLKGRIDEKIEKRVETSLKSLKDQQETLLGDPYLDYTLDDTLFSAAGLQNLYDKAGEKGMIPEVLQANVTPEVLSNALKKAIPAFAGSDLRNALALRVVQNGFEAVEAGTMTLEEFKQVVADKAPGVPDHVLNLMQAVPMNEVNDVILQTVKDAAAMKKQFDDLEADAENQFNDNVNAIYNRYYFYKSKDNKSQEFNVNELTQMFPNIKIVGTRTVIDADGERTVAPGYRMAEAIKNHLASVNELTFEMRQQMDKFDQEPPEKRQASDRDVINFLNELDAFDNLDLQTVLSKSDYLTQADLLRFTEKAQSEAVAGENEAKQYIKNALRYQTSELISAEVDKDLALRVTNQIDDIYTQIDDLIRQKRIAGEPLTKTQIEEAARNMLAASAPRFKEVILEQYQDTLNSAVRVSVFFPIKTNLQAAQTPADAIIIISDWYNNLSSPDANETKRYGQYLRSFTEMKNKIDAIDNVNRQ
tara:strand:- start:9581 stop:11413 length:1833 start_codon:yes stop_codon:yes gene_type:complete